MRIHTGANQSRPFTHLNSLASKSLISKICSMTLHSFSIGIFVVTIIHIFNQVLELQQQYWWQCAISIESFISLCDVIRIFVLDHGRILSLGILLFCSLAHCIGTSYSSMVPNEYPTICSFTFSLSVTVFSLFIYQCLASYCFAIERHKNWIELRLFPTLCFSFSQTWCNCLI